jgi:hypothetical protein
MDMEFGSVSSFNDNSDTIVLIFFKAADDAEWQSDTVNFDRVPNVGEYFTASRDGDWYEVKAVVHMGFPLDYDAEVYAIKVENKIALRQSFGK